MSTPILPLAVWQSGTNENSLPANDNALRVEVLQGYVISKTTDAQPGSPGDGDIYIMTAAASGAQWSGFDLDDLAIFRDGTWYAFAPIEGIVVNVAGSLQQYGGSGGYSPVGGGGGATWGGIGGTLPDQTDLQSALDAKEKIRSTVTAVTSSSGAVTLNYALGDYFTLALSENVTSWVISNPPGSGKGFSLMVQITQDSTPRTVVDPGTTAGGVAIDVSTASGAVDVLAITSFNNGTTLRSTIAKAFS